MKKLSKIKEIGDYRFPLEVDIENGINTNHSLVGKTVLVNSYANEVLKSFRNKKALVTGVIEKHGQLAGLRVSVDNKTFYSPKKDFFIDKTFVEDIHLDSALSVYIRNALAHWNGQHDYYGPSWSGIECFHFHLAKVVNLVSVESAGWYKYTSSLREDMDGKNWRLIVPSRGECVVVNCHSLLHDYVWTLNTTVFSSKEVQFSTMDYTGDADHWTRTLLWTRKVAESLESDGYDYSDTKKEIDFRLKANGMLRKKVQEFLPFLCEKFVEVSGEKIDQLTSLSVGFSNVRVLPLSIGRHEKPTDIQPYSILTIKPMALKDKDYLDKVIKHELIHYVINHCKQAHEKPHGNLFKEMADAIGLPKKYQD